MNNDNETQTGTQPAQSQGQASQSSGQNNPWQPDYSFQEGKGGGQQADQQQKPSTPPSTPQPVLDKKSLQELVQGVAQAVRPQEQPAQVTQEEFDRVMNVLRVKPQHLAQLGLQEGALPALEELLQGVAKQSVTMATYQLNQLKRDLQTAL